MSVRVKITSATIDTKRNFFEIVGQPGRLYVSEYAFGEEWTIGGRQAAHTTFSLQGTGHAIPSIRSPLHLIPDDFSAPVINVLRAYWNEFTDHKNHPGDSDAKTLIPQCAIGEETYYKGSTIRVTKYRFYDVQVRWIYERKNLNSLEYTLPFRNWTR